MRKILPLLLCFVFSSSSCYSWGFYAHKRINTLAVFLLPPKMLGFYKKHISHLADHAVDPDKRRYAVPEEGPRHYIDMDHYGVYPFRALPHQWEEAKEKFSADTLQSHGILPWWVETMQLRLIKAFRDKDAARILRCSAELGHYLSDAHVPLHTSSNHNGQFTGQEGIHGFWESRLPELLCEKHWDFFLEPALYLKDPQSYLWKKILESARASDSVLRLEKELSQHFPPSQKYSIEDRKGQLVKTYSASYSQRYDQMLQGMVERRMRSAVLTVASFWYTAWVNAGQPNLDETTSTTQGPLDQMISSYLEKAWLDHRIQGRNCD